MRPERPVVADDRGDDEVADPGPGGHRIGLGDVLELARQVVAGRDHATFRHRLARQPLADAQPLRADEVALIVGQARVVGRDEDALVGHRTRR